MRQSAPSVLHTREVLEGAARTAADGAFAARGALEFVSTLRTALPATLQRAHVGVARASAAAEAAAARQRAGAEEERRRRVRVRGAAVSSYYSQALGLVGETAAAALPSTLWRRSGSEGQRTSSGGGGGGG